MLPGTESCGVDILTWYIKSCDISVSLDHLLLAAFGEQQACDAGLPIRPSLMLDLSADRHCKALWHCLPKGDVAANC